MLKKIYRAIVLFIYGLVNGMRSGNELLNAQSNEDNANNSGSGVEQQQEKKSVLNDLIRGEVTEEVRELRHEMYYAERKSHEYVYSGGGHAKKNKMFDYQGNVEKSDGFNILIVQNNDLIPTSLSESGIQVYGKNVDVSKTIENELRNKTRSEKNYRIKFDRTFIPRFKIENYLNKVVIKEVQDDVVMVDLYITKYINKLEPTSKLFHAEMEKLYQGFVKNTDVIDFDRMHFVAYRAYGIDNLVEIAFNDFKYDNIVEFDGNYVLKFYAKKEKVHDFIEEFYNEKTAEKCEKHEMREGYVADFNVELGKIERDKLDVSEQLDLIDKTKTTD